MAVIQVDGQLIKVPNGVMCTGCNYSQYNLKTDKVYGVTVTIDEYTYCTLFNKRTPGDVKLAKCIYSQLR